MYWIVPTSSAWEDTAALEEAAGDANTAEEALAFFDHIKLINV